MLFGFICFFIFVLFRLLSSRAYATPFSLLVQRKGRKRKDTSVQLLLTTQSAFVASVRRAVLPANLDLRPADPRQSLH